MFSTKSVAFLSTCSIGIGVAIGRHSRNVDLDDRNNSSHLENPFVFPTAYAKSTLIPTKSSRSKPSDTDSDAADKENKQNINKGRQNTDTHDPKRVGEILKYGIPSLENVRTFEDYILSYDKRNRIANWVLEHLTGERVDKKSVDRKNIKFAEDQSFHAFHRSTNQDFQGSGYDRGHLAAAANHRQTLTAMSQTFLLSNVAPQVGEGFNRDAWNNLEKYTRALARKYSNVYVCTGPLYLPKREPDGRLYVKYEVIGENHVAVPTHFFKVLLIEDEKEQKELQSFVLPNAPLFNAKLENYLVPVESIERAAGIHLFDKLTKNTLKQVTTSL